MSNEARQLPLKDCIAVVTGASRGAGRGIAVELGAAGATVYVTGRSTRNGACANLWRAAVAVGARRRCRAASTKRPTSVTRAGGRGIADALRPQPRRRKWPSCSRAFSASKAGSICS